MRVATRCTFALVSLFAFHARAQAAAIALSWEAPAECPSRGSVVAAVQRLVRSAPETPLPAQARIVHERARWTAELKTPSGHRTLEAETCLALAEAMVVILAIAVDPGAADQVSVKPTFEDQPRSDDSVLPPPPVAGGPAPQDPGPAPARPLPASAVAQRGPPPSSAASWSISPALRALFEIGIMPEPAIGGTLAVRVDRGIAGLELGASALLPHDGKLEGDSRSGGTFWWFAGHALGCVGPRAVVAWDVCAGVEVGELQGSGFGVDTPKTGRALWFGPLALAGARFGLGSNLALEARLGLAIPTPRPPAFGLDAPLGEVHRPAVISGRLELGIRWN